MFSEFGPPHKPQRPRHSLARRRLILIMMIIVVYGFVSYVLPLPSIQPQAEALRLPKSPTSTIQWPTYGQAAIGSPGYGVLDHHADTKAVPTASVAKVLTALAVLKQRPLNKGQMGSLITITDDDVAVYQAYNQALGSVIPVQTGEQLSEYQALQGLLLPSANNMADLLAHWAFGSTNEYVTFANAFIRSLGLNHTTIADASGFSPKTTSTASDLVLLGENVMDNPVLAEIVGQQQADLPVAGTVHNVNLLVGHQEVIGIKTGNTDEAGGCFMVAARHAVDKAHEVVVITVILGAPDLATAIANTLPLLQSAYLNFAVKTSLKPGQVVGNYQLPWGQRGSLTTTKSIAGVTWLASPPPVQISLSPVRFAVGKKAVPAGEVRVTYGRQQIVVPVSGESFSPPPIWWRLTHPLRH